MGLAMTNSMQGMMGGGAPQGSPSHAPPPVPNVIWHVAENGEAMGPFTPAQMSQAIAGGRVTPTSLVWCAGMEGWLVAAEVDALAGQFAPAPPPVPEG